MKSKLIGLSRRTADAEDLAVELGQPIVVENRSGANSIIATDFVAKAAPDGYTMLVSTLAAHAGNPSAVKALPYHPIHDFAPVTVINTVPLLLVAHPTFAAQTVADVVRLARPGEVHARAVSRRLLLGAWRCAYSG